MNLINTVFLSFLLSFSFAAQSEEAANKGFSFLGVELDKSSFKDVKDLFGDGDIYQKLDPNSNSLTWICFKNKNSIQAEFGSAETSASTINEIRISPAPSRRRSSSGCKVSEKIAVKAKFDNGIGLGTDKAEIIKHLGDPKDDKGHSLVYAFENKLKTGTELLSIEINLDSHKRSRAISIFKTVNH